MVFQKSSIGFAVNHKTIYMKKILVIDSFGSLPIANSLLEKAVNKIFEGMAEIVHVYEDYKGQEKFDMFILSGKLVLEECIDVSTLVKNFGMPQCKVVIMSFIYNIKDFSKLRNLCVFVDKDDIRHNDETRIQLQEFLISDKSFDLKAYQKAEKQKLFKKKKQKLLEWALLISAVGVILLVMYAIALWYTIYH